mmetsp:Transcript_25600/g.36078  ORF Transcript_25600/g.36078 Transcript_25600/m.36078 type:complete len:185 (+) Transcript_25600:18-572(+)
MSSSIASRMVLLQQSVSSTFVKQLRSVTTFSGSQTNLITFFQQPQHQQHQQKRCLGSKPSSKKAVVGDEGVRVRDKQLEVALAALNAPVAKEPEVDEEEKKRRYEIGRNYNIGRANRHNDLHHDLSCKVRLKNHAIRMLPKNSKVREEALKIDPSGPPLWRDIPADTPPIPGFDPNVFLEGEEI